MASQAALKRDARVTVVFWFCLSSVVALLSVGGSDFSWPVWAGGMGCSVCLCGVVPLLVFWMPSSDVWAGYAL